MGDEIPRRHFNAEDFSIFRFRLDEETRLLAEQFASSRFSRRGDIAGFELEAWLVDPEGNPLPKNHDFLERLNNPLVVPELASFNVELNGSPTALAGRTFTRLRDELAATWQACQETAEAMGCHLVTVGILPTIRDAPAEFGPHVENGPLPGPERPGDGASRRQAAASADRRRRRP